MMTPEPVRPEEAIDRFRRQVVVRISLLLKTTTLHALSNAALQRPIADALETIHAATSGEVEPLRLQTVGESFFVNNEIVRLDFASFESGETLRKILKRVGASEIAFHHPPSEPELRGFLELFQRYFRSKTPAELCQAATGKFTLRPIRSAVHAGFVEIDDRQNLLRAYVLLALAIKSAAEDTKKKRAPRIAQLRRAIHGLADASLDLGGLLVAITRFPSLSGEPEFHLASTTALVLLMGRRLGLSRPALSELCLAAALHDLSRADRMEANGEHAELAHRIDAVPLESALRIAGGDVGPEILAYACAALEHRLPLERNPCASARIIAVACAYDLLTESSPIRAAIAPDHALSLIRAHADRFDPIATELFASVAGVFPPGTLVRLSSGETGVVLEPPIDARHFAQPPVKMVKDAYGRASDQSVDLSRTPTRIVEVLDPDEADIHPAQVLFA
jgi:hypothetical protein